MFMLRFRGTGRNSHISGSSTHNQRIERLWRDVYRCVISTFHSLFYYIEQYHGLDPLSDLQFFCQGLTIVFLNLQTVGTIIQCEMKKTGLLRKCG